MAGDLALADAYCRSRRQKLAAVVFGVPVSNVSKLASHLATVSRLGQQRATRSVFGHLGQWGCTDLPGSLF
jgi:hypothetical protein